MSQSLADGVIEQAVRTGRHGQLCGQRWTPQTEDPLGTVVMVHGLGEHSQRYRPLAADLASHRWASLTADLPGHGRSPGRRGHIRSYRSLLAEIAGMLQSAAAALPGRPLVLLGHSMGGNLAANYVLRRRDVAPQAPAPIGLVLSGPMFLPTKPPPRPQIFAAWLTGHLLPWWTIRAPVCSDQLTRNQAEIDRLANDPLTHRRLSLYLGTQLLAQGRHALDHAAQIDLPTLVLHGTDDPITSHRASESFAVRVGPHAQFIPLHGMLHEIFHEPDRHRVIAALAQWLDALDTDR